MKEPFTPESFSISAFLSLVSSARTRRRRVAQWAALRIFSFPPTRRRISSANCSYCIFSLLFPASHKGIKPCLFRISCTALSFHIHDSIFQIFVGIFGFCIFLLKIKIKKDLSCFSSAYLQTSERSLSNGISQRLFVRYIHDHVGILKNF